MKATIVFTPSFIHFATQRNMDVARITQAVEAYLGGRRLVGIESMGTKNGKKSQVAKGKEQHEYETASCAVSAFIQWTEDKVGTLARLDSKLAKECAMPLVLAGVPKQVHGFDVAGWLESFTLDAQADKAAKAKAKAEAKAALEATKAQVEAAKAAKAPVS